MHLSSGYEERRARVEIVPLIDVVFLLLVFFIYAMLSMTMYRGLRVRLPRGAGTPENLTTVVITVAADNSLWVEERPVAIGEAVDLAAQRVRDTGVPVLVSGDRRADLGVAVELLGKLRREGVEAVSFQVRQDE